MATERLRFVNTASTAGGDGTTNNTTGATRAYVSLSAAIAAEAANLVTADVFLVIKCDSPTAADTAVVAVTGYTTDATRYIDIVGNDGVATGRHAGKDAGNSYRVVTNAATHVFTVSEAFTKFRGFIVGPMGASHGASDEAFRLAGGADNCLLDGMIVHGIDAGTSNDAIYMGVGGLTATVKNSVFYNIARGVGTIQGVQNGHFIFYNCTAYNCLSNVASAPYAVFGPDTDAARNNTGSTYRVKNCAGHRSGAGLVYREGGAVGQEAVYTADSDNNMASDTSASTVWSAGAWANPFDSTVFQAATTPTTGNRFMVASLTGGSENFHLLDDANNDAKGNGIDLSSDATFAFSDDFDFAARVAPWDIGADQIAAAGGVTRTVTGSLDAAARKQITVAASLNAGVSANITQAMAADAALRAARDAQAQLEAALERTASGQSAADGVLRAVRTLSGAAEAAIAKAVELAASLDASIAGAGVGLRDAALDAAVERLLTVAMTLNAALARLSALQAGLDAGLSVRGMSVAALDGAIERLDILAGLALEAAVRHSVDLTAVFDAVIGAVVAPSAGRTFHVPARGGHAVPGDLRTLVIPGGNRRH